jgi:hypothetical protein
LVGVDAALPGGRSSWPLRPEFEYGLILLTGALTVDGQPVRPGQLAYLGRGREELVLTADGPTRTLLLGGEPFAEPLLMWWNFVARSRAEIDEAYLAWDQASERFGAVQSTLPRIPAAAPPWRPGS